MLSFVGLRRLQITGQGISMTADTAPFDMRNDLHRALLEVPLHFGEGRCCLLADLLET